MALVKVEQGVVKVENYTPVRYATVTVPDILLILEGGFLNFFYYTVLQQNRGPVFLPVFLTPIWGLDQGMKGQIHML
jgi:hypothetical protein